MLSKQQGADIILLSLTQRVSACLRSLQSTLLRCQVGFGKGRQFRAITWHQGLWICSCLGLFTATSAGLKDLSYAVASHEILNTEEPSLLTPPPSALVGGPLHLLEGQFVHVTGMHQEECGQQVTGGSPFPLHCPSEASSGVLCPVLGSPVQER